jgi:uncharacterized protein (TIGR01777 family)
MKIVVAGGSGFLGEPFVRRLADRGHDVVVLSRNPERVRVGPGVPWNPPAVDGWANEIDDADAIVNLAGENIGAGRWTEERRRKLISSRVDSTRALVEAMKRQARPRVFVSASAVGFYGDRGDETLDEQSSAGSGFLADLVKRWEEEARRAGDSARVVLARLGVVIGPGGGALEKMLLPFKLGVGGPIGSGTQWMSWVDRHDVQRFIEWALGRTDARGIFNVTSPQPVRNRDFSKALGRVLHRPAVMPVPSFVLRLALGQMADEALLASQRVLPKRTTESGFTFERPEIESALRHALTLGMTSPVS